MKWIQWTDMHVGLAGQETRGVDVRSNAEQVAEWLKEIHFDQLVLSGDICYDFGREEVYAWLAKLLRPWKDKIRAIPGNHDDPELLMQYFNSPAENGNTYYEEIIDGQSVFYLDSSPGLLSEPQWNWLEDRWTANSSPAIVFMHHPPVPAGVPYMDRSYAFLQPNRFLELIHGHHRQCFLFCGHYHLERTVHIDQLTMSISPTSFFQIDPSEHDFKVDHHRMGLRSIERSGKQLRTWVDYRATRSEETTSSDAS